MEINPYVLGVAGGSASGKSTFIKRISEELGAENICIFSTDNYYYPREKQPIDINGEKNFDLPESIDVAKLTSDLLNLISGQTVLKSEYTFNNPAIVPSVLTFEPKNVILVEGLFVFHFENIRNLFDMKIFIEAKDHLKLIRRIKRDKIERGYCLEDILYRYEKHVMPTYDKYIRPYRYISDVIVYNNEEGFEPTLHMVADFLKTKL